MASPYDMKLFKNNPEVLVNATGVHLLNGGDSALILKKDGLYGFGKNDIRIPISNNKDYSHSPVKVQYLAVQNGVRDLSTGIEHAVLLEDNGVVWCWGSNKEGQCGAGHVKESNLPFAPLNLLSRSIKTVTCGAFFTVALGINGDVWVWGKITVDMKHLRPARYSTAIEIFAGYDHFAVLNLDGVVKTWGNNEYKQLGRCNESSYAKVVSSEISCRFMAVMASCRITAFLSKEGLLYVTDKMKKDSSGYHCYTGLRGDIISMSGSWASSSIGVTVRRNGKLIVYELGKIIGNECHLAVETDYKHELEIFKDRCTPTVATLNNTATSNYISCAMNVSSLQKVENNILRVFQGLLRSSFYFIYNYMNVVEIQEGQRLTIFYAPLYNKEEYSDLKIILRDDQLFVHKIVLGHRSSYLKQLLDLERIRGNERKEWDMTNYNPGAYRAYIRYLYTDRVKLNMENIADLYSISKEAKEPKLVQACVKFWTRNLNMDNVLKWYEVAFQHKAKVLADAGGRLILKHFSHISTTPEYHRLRPDVKLSVAELAARVGIKMVN